MLKEIREEFPCYFSIKEHSENKTGPVETETMIVEMKNSVGRQEVKIEKTSQKVRGKFRDGWWERKDKKFSPQF